jgi:hypothetical protein
VTLGPLEYLVVGFTGPKFDGSIADEISRVVESGTIRLVDLVVIAKDAEGDAVVLEVDLKDDPRFASFSNLLEGRVGLFTEEDVTTIAESIPENTAAAALLFEHRWAVRIKEAMMQSGGFLVSRSVIAPEIVEEISAELDIAQADIAAQALGTGA